jgi:RNA polymerase sigma-70 factor (ECF subfamily)
MHTVARNRAVARTRSKEARRRALERLRRVQPPGPVDDDFGVEEVPSVHELASLVLGGLRPIYRDVVVAYYLDELSVEEISRELGLPADTIYTRLRRARRAMLQVLREHGHG